MKIYWTLKSIPELKHLPFRERGRRWRSVYKLAFRHWQTWAGLAVCGALGYTGAYFYGTAGTVILAALGGFFYGQTVTHVVLKYYPDKLCSEAD